MGFLSNKFAIIALIILAFIFLIWRINQIKDELKQAKQDLEIYAEAEALKQKAYKLHNEKMVEMQKELITYKEKLNEAEKSEENSNWLETVIPAGVDSSIPY